MINLNLLKSEIVKNGLTQKEVAQRIGISEQAFTRRMKRGKFGTDEVYKMLELLDLNDPIPVFFAREVT